MSNLTISMDDKLIKAARVQAIQQGTSLSAKIRDFVTQYVADGIPTQPYAPVKLPVYSGGSGLAPGIDPSSNKSYLEAMGD
jgi:plasmid stability protein